MAIPIQPVGNEPVAICGMGCRWSGGVKDAPGLWEMLRNKRDGWRKFSEPRFPAEGFFHANQDRPGSLRTEGAFLLDEDPLQFDHSFFNIMGREVETMDPSQRKLLEVVYEAFENAGETFESIDGSRTGVYIGNFALDHLLIQARDWEYTKPYAATGAETSILANRVSYVFNLHGPSLATNTACSSSMYALHLAVSAIRNGDCDGAIVAAANWISDPSMSIVLDKLGALSPTSRCHTFDAAADGYARGEGFVALYLRKSDIAILDGLPIRAMIRGTAVNANGKTGGITRPSARGQEDAIRKAYENAGNLPLSDTTFFECHGTGTPAGDPLEVAAVGNVFASSRKSNAEEDRLLIGSVKPNLGHTEGASALASIMKVVLSLEAGEIPPTAGIEMLNPHIDFDGAKVSVVQETIPWPAGKVRRASVNSFGFGGANGHCIIDHVNEVLQDYVKPGIAKEVAVGRVGISSPTPPHTPPHHSPITSAIKKQFKANAPTRQLTLLPFSAHNASSLKHNIDALSNVIDQWSLADVAYTLGCKRSKLQQRTFRIVDKDDVASSLGAEERVFSSPIQTSNVAYVFTGQGAQWHTMGVHLLDYAIFRDGLTYLDSVLKDLPDCPDWTIAGTISGAYKTEHIQLPKVSQVVCTAVQIGIVDLFASWSIKPVAVAGHSSGEMAAAYASGHLTAAEAITAAFYRGQAVSKNTQKGAMLAVGLGVEQVSTYLTDKKATVRIAAMNSPNSVTLSGDVEAVNEVAAALNKDGVFNRILRTSGSAYHSHHMLAIGGDYIDMLDSGFESLKKLGFLDNAQRYPKIPWASSVILDEVIDETELGSAYWRQNLESPVRFTQAITKMMSLEGISIQGIIEIGPHAALKGPLDQTLKSIGKSIQYIPSLQRNEDGRLSVLRLAGTMFAFNAEIDIAAVNSVDDLKSGGKAHLTHGCLAVGLPAYQYSYGPVSYYESRASKEFRLRQTLRHDLLGSQIPGTSKLQPQWMNVLRLKDIPWLGDHRLLPDAVFPAAGYVALGIEAATRVYNNVPDVPSITGYSLRDVNIENVLRIPEDDYGIEIVVAMDLVENGTASAPTWNKFTVTSVNRESTSWNQHCSGFVRVETAETKTRPNIGYKLDARFPDPRAWYNKFTDVGLGYGPTFQTLSYIQVDPHRNSATASVAMNTTAIAGGESHYPLHPSALDATFQLAIINFYGGQLEKATTAFVPVHLSKVYIKAGVQEHMTTAITNGSIQGPRSAYAQLQLLDSNGQTILDVESMRFSSFTELKHGKEMRSKQPFSSPFTRLAWKPDIRSMTNVQLRQLFPPPTENEEGAASLEVVDLICCLTAFEIYDKFVTGTAKPNPKGDIKHWLAWIKRIVENDQRPNMIEARKHTPEQRRQLLAKLYKRAGHKPESQAAKLLYENATEILNETRTGIDVLISHKLLTSLYEVGHAIAGSHPQVYNVMNLLSHANPNARILEIGAGTGCATRAAMRALVGENGIKRYADYTFTDISAGFLTSAKEMLAEYRDIHYSVLDIEQDPMNNGYEPVYDVVLACEAIHATKSMDETLAHCRSLLKPGGKLVLVETTRMRVLLGLLYGTLTGYWQHDGRTEGPFMNLETWQRRLVETGFSGVDMHVDDYVAPHNTTSVLITTRVDEQYVNTVDQIKSKAENIYLLQDKTSPLSTQIAADLTARGSICKSCRIHDVAEVIPTDARVIAFLNDDNDLFEANESRLKAYQYLAKNVRSMVWLTSDGIVKGQNPRGAFMAGLLRVIATENPAGRFLSIDVPEGQFEREDAALVASIINQEQSLQGENSSDSIDSEFVWQDDCMWVSRVVPDVGLGEYSETISTPARQGTQMLPMDQGQPICAAFETIGVSNSLYFRPHTELLRPIPSGFIDIKTAAMTLSERDVARATGRGDATGKHLSSEYSGTVVRVGAGVTDFAIGDRVYGLDKGYFGNYERVPAASARKLQGSSDFSEAAAVPLPFMSAVYAFEHVAHLRKGQKVLIQSAYGDLGFAAVKIAQLRGADVFVTVDSLASISLLENAPKIDHDHIYSSKDIDALSSTAEDLKKGGFDVILNTSADLISTSPVINMLAPLGHLICIGRTASTPATSDRHHNIHFSSFDLLEVLYHDEELGQQLLDTVNELYQLKQISPSSTTVCSISELDQALQRLSAGSEIKKMVISFQEPESMVKIIQQPQAAVFDSDACYVITGGFGGLGRSIIRWMVNRGARDFVVLSRRGATTRLAQILVDDMTARGVQLRAIACDVSDKLQVVQSIKEVSASGRTIKGIVHAVLSLSDLSFDKLTADQWRRGTVGKTLGSINLHEATVDLPLDFFVMLTSTETVWAPPTQSAYIAADNFATYFARYRRKLGLPASTISYGFVSDLGSDYRETSHGTEDMYARNLALPMTELQALATLEPAFLSSHRSSKWFGQDYDPLSAATYFTCLSPLDLAALNSSNTPRWHRDGRVSLLMRAIADAKRHVLSQADGGLDSDSDDTSASNTARIRRTFDEHVKTGGDGRADTIEFVVDSVSKMIAEMLFIDPGSINVNKSIAEHGVDSLISAEMRNWFHQALKTTPPNLLDSDTSIQLLSEQIVDQALSAAD